MNLNQRSLLYIIPYSTHFFSSIYESAIIPLLYSIVENDTTSGYVHPDNINTWISFIYMSSLITASISILTQGFFADYFGYKPTYIFCFLCAIVGCTIQVVFYTNVMYIVVGQIFMGLSSTTVVTHAFIHSIEDDSKSLKMQQMYNYLYISGYLCGMLLSGILSLYLGNQTWQMVNWISLVANIVILLLILFVYEPNLHRKKKCPCSCLNLFRLEDTKSVKQPSERENSFRDGKIVFSVRNILSKIVGETVIGVSVTVCYAFLSVQLTDRYNITVFWTSIIFIVFTCLEFSFSLCVAPLVFNYIPDDDKKITGSFIVLGVIYILTGIVPIVYDNEYVLCGMISIAIMITVVPFIIVRSSALLRVPEKKRSRMLSLLLFGRTIGYIIGTGSYAISELYYPSPFFCMGLLCILSSFLALNTYSIDRMKSLEIKSES